MTEKAIADKVLQARPTLLEYVRLRAQLEDESCRRWKAETAKQMECYRAGSANAYEDIFSKLTTEWFKNS